MQPGEDGLDAAVCLRVVGEPELVDDPLGNGAAGLQAYDAGEDESADRFLIAWHDFEVAPAPQA